MLLALTGFTLIISDAQPVATPGTDVLGEPSTFAKVFGGGTYSELIWALAIVIVLQLVLSFTRWGDLHGRRRQQPASAPPRPASRSAS